MSEQLGDDLVQIDNRLHYYSLHLLFIFETALPESLDQ